MREGVLAGSRADAIDMITFFYPAKSTVQNDLFSGSRECWIYCYGSECVRVWRSSSIAVAFVIAHFKVQLTLGSTSCQLQLGASNLFGAQVRDGQSHQGPRTRTRLSRRNPGNLRYEVRQINVRMFVPGVAAGDSLLVTKKQIRVLTQ